MDADSVQCCVTSPPYWGLRDYGHADQIGLERTPDEYVAKLVAVFAAVRRVLADDGVLWLNLGDCYATGGGKVGVCPGGGEQGDRWMQGRDDGNGRGTPSRADGEARDLAYYGPRQQPNRLPLPGLKPKDLVGIPWRVAFALQADGWYLRSEIIWHKPAPMPESVTDRPTRSHEQIFLFAKSEQYFYDADAIAEPATCADEARFDPGTNGLSGADRKTGTTTRRFKSGNKRREYDDAVGRPESHLGRSVPWEGVTRNRRTVWTVAGKPFKGAHFATFPPALIEPCILAGSRLGDTVLDPFGGAGTTGLVADRLGRSSVLIELNPEYAEMARRRIADDAPLFAEFGP